MASQIDVAYAATRVGPHWRALQHAAAEAAPRRGRPRSADAADRTASAGWDGEARRHGCGPSVPWVGTSGAAGDVTDLAVQGVTPVAGLGRDDPRAVQQLPLRIGRVVAFPLLGQIQEHDPVPLVGGEVASVDRGRACLVLLVHRHSLRDLAYPRTRRAGSQLPQRLPVLVGQSRVSQAGSTHQRVGRVGTVVVDEVEAVLRDGEEHVAEVPRDEVWVRDRDFFDEVIGAVPHRLSVSLPRRAWVFWEDVWMTPRSGSSKKGEDGIGPAPGMRRGGTVSIERHGVWVVQGLVQNQLNWLFREQPIDDYGVDAHAEIVAEDDLVTGRMIGLQIKSGNSHFTRETSNGWEFRSDSNHLAYWLGHSLPVIIVIVDPTEKTYWQIVSTETVSETKKGFMVTIPRNQPFDQSARDRLLALAGRSVGLLDALPRYYSLLPPDAVRPLRRAEKIDRLATARLAERLSSGRATPGMTAASVTAAQPSWLLASAAVQDLWMAVSGFAAEHRQDREAARGFELAADSPGPQSARARAFAGLALFFIDREKAGVHLRRARDEGQALLADVGLPYLEVPEGDARVVEIPQSMRDASDAELDAEPTVLNFLGEMALRRGDLNAAFAYRERAVDSSGESGSAVRLELARTIWRRTAAEGSRSPRERRRAISHAQAAIEERRRWDGPSTEALAVLLDILTTSADVLEALKAALPASQGGTARDAEAMDEDVARRGGLAALMAGNQQALEFFKQTLPEGPHLHELQALEKDTEDLSVEEHIEIWTRLLDEASDDAMAMRSISRLVNLGVWPPQVDTLLDRHIIPTDTALMFKALWRAKSGELDLGIAELRDLATRTSTAALALVELLEKDLDPDSAIQECERQVDRWGDPALIMLLADLTRRHGYPDRAAEVIKASIANEALSPDVRLDMCKWYVARKLTNREYTDAISVARQGLAIGDDPDLAWQLIVALYNNGKVTQARDALARHKPEPTSEIETRLWMQLHLGTPVSADDAHVMVDLAHRQPNGDLRNAIISHVVREVLHAPQQTDRAYPATIVDAVRQLAEDLGPESPGGLRLANADDETLREILAREQVDPMKAQKLTNDIRHGLSSHADLASMTRRPYGAVLPPAPRWCPVHRRPNTRFTKGR